MEPRRTKKTRRSSPANKEDRVLKIELIRVSIAMKGSKQSTMAVYDILKNLPNSEIDVIKKWLGSLKTK